MKEFIDFYYRSTYNAILRLTRLQDPRILRKLTLTILTEVWDQHDLFDATESKGIFIYKVMVKHVIQFLQQRNEKEKLDFLQKTLLIHPKHYL